MNFILTCLGVALSIGCAPSAEIELPLSQLAAAADTGTITEIDAILTFDTGDIGCERAELLYRDAPCEVVEQQTFVQIPGIAAVVPPDHARTQQDDMLLEVARRQDRTQAIEVTIAQTFDYLRQRGDDTPATNHVPIFRFKIVNDTREDVGLQFDQTFVGDVPFMSDQGMHMPSGDSVVVQLSDVSSAALAERAVTFLQVFPYP